MSKQIIKKGSSGAAAVLISRFLGLLRDILLARFIGGGAVMSAWVIAFRIPNTFRRFFGEGAASQALIPMLEHIIQEQGIAKAKKSFGTVFATLGTVLALISIIVALASLIAIPYFHNVERIRITLLLLTILMPYTVFICLTGICIGILNLFGKFFLPALSSVILNIFIIATLFLFNNLAQVKLVNYVSWSVLISGFVQLLGMLYLLKRNNMFPENLRPALLKNPAVKEFVTLAVPGFIGAAAVQINTMVDSFIALYLGNYAAPALYYSERIIYLPLGIFAVSMGSASLVTMTKYAVAKQYKELAMSVSYGLRQILYLTVPIAFLFFIYRTQIITLIYSGDKFGTKEIAEAAWATLFYCSGIPAFAGIKIIISGFYAQKKMKTPVKIALFCVLINFLLNLALMFPLQQGGIALSTAISSYLNCGILYFILMKKNEVKKIVNKEILISGAKILLSAALASTASIVTFYILSHSLTISKIDWRGIIVLGVSMAVFGLFYFFINFIIKSSEQNEWVEIFSDKLLKRKKY